MGPPKKAIAYCCTVQTSFSGCPSPGLHTKRKEKKTSNLAPSVLELVLGLKLRTTLVPRATERGKRLILRQPARRQKMIGFWFKDGGTKLPQDWKASCPSRVGMVLANRPLCTRSSGSRYSSLSTASTCLSNRLRFPAAWSCT